MIIITVTKYTTILNPSLRFK